jgi:hypothetical protein
MAFSQNRYRCSNATKWQHSINPTASVKDEYIKFLKEYGIEYNEDYLWT